MALPEALQRALDNRANDPDMSQDELSELVQSIVDHATSPEGDSDKLRTWLDVLAVSAIGIFDVVMEWMLHPSTSITDISRTVAYDLAYHYR